MDFSWLANPEYLALFWQGFVNTLGLVAISGTLGFALALGLAMARISSIPILTPFVRGYITVIRGTPLLLQLFFFYNGIGNLLIGGLASAFPGIVHTFLWPILRGSFLYGAITFIVSVSAYVAEDLRAALLSVPAGELEAGRAFGMSRLKVFRRLWLPRALQIGMPALTNQAILLLKSIPLVSTIAVMDLLQAADTVRDTLLLVYEPLLFIAGIYVALAAILTICANMLELRFTGAHRVSKQLTLRSALSHFTTMGRR